MSQDDLSKDTVAPVGIDLIAGTLGSFTRGGVVAPQNSGSVTATGAVGSAVEISGHGTARLDLVTTVAPGTTYTVTIQTSEDNGVADAWRTVAAFSAQTAVGTVRQCFAGCDRFIRANVTTLTGEPVAFTLSGEVV